MKLRFLLVGAALLFTATPASAQLNGCLPAPMILVSLPGPTQLSLDIFGEPGINYAIERSDDFANWTRVSTNRSDSGVLNFRYPVPPSAQQFFRALSVTAQDGLGGSFIFDGETFAGWEGDTGGLFQIGECAIMGDSLTESIPSNMYLCTSRTYRNFILRLEFKFIGGSTANSGIQFRSKRVNNSTEVSGYQADMGTGYWGSLWDQSRRNKVLAPADEAAVTGVLRNNDWNSYVIKAEGTRIQFWINGYQTIDYTETLGTIPLDGVIGFQVHSRAPIQVSFRHVNLEVLP